MIRDTPPINSLEPFRGLDTLLWRHIWPSGVSSGNFPLMIAVNGKMFSSIATKTRKAKLENIFLFLCAEKDQLQLQYFQNHLLVFSCPGQLNRCPYHPLTLTFDFCVYNDYNDYNKVNRCLVRYSPTTNQPTNRAPNEPARCGPK